MPKEKRPKKLEWTKEDEEKLVSESFLIYLILIFLVYLYYRFYCRLMLGLCILMIPSPATIRADQVSGAK